MIKLKIITNPDINKYNKISEAVKENDGYCPCLIERNEDTKCVCKDFKEQYSEGECHCGRYIKITNQQIINIK